MDERRNSPRLRLRRKIGVVLSSGQLVELWSYDISEHGIQLTSPYAADVGDEFTLVFSALDPRIDDYAEVRIRVRVIHVVYEGVIGSFRIGMQFIRFLGESGPLFKRYLERQFELHYTLKR